ESTCALGPVEAGVGTANPETDGEQGGNDQREQTHDGRGDRGLRDHQDDRESDEEHGAGEQPGIDGATHDPQPCDATHPAGDVVLALGDPQPAHDGEGRRTEPKDERGDDERRHDATSWSISWSSFLTSTARSPSSRWPAP